MTIRELAEAIASGIVIAGVEGDFSSLTCSTGGDYPSVGVSSWEGSRADDLLAGIPGGDAFIGRSYSSFTTEEKHALRALLSSEEGRNRQQRLLTKDCFAYAEALSRIEALGQGASAVYAGMWCPTSTAVVVTFLQNRAHRGPLAELPFLHYLFYEEYAGAAGCFAYEKGYKNRAAATYDYARRFI